MVLNRVSWPEAGSKPSCLLIYTCTWCYCCYGIYINPGYFCLLMLAKRINMIKHSFQLQKNDIQSCHTGIIIDVTREPVNSIRGCMRMHTRELARISVLMQRS